MPKVKKITFSLTSVNGICYCCAIVDPESKLPGLTIRYLLTLRHVNLIKLASNKPVCNNGAVYSLLLSRMPQDEDNNNNDEDDHNIITIIIIIIIIR